MRKNLFWLMMVLLVSWMACNPADDTPGVDCSPINVAPLSFTENTKAWYPYVGPEVLVFSNETGDTIRFRRNEPFDSIFTFRYDGEYKLRRTGCPDSIRVRYDYPTKIGLFESDSLGLFIYADIRVAPIEGLFPPAFFEGLRVNVGKYLGSNSSQLFAEMAFVTDNEEQLCSADATVCEEYEILDSVTLLGKTFENVFYKPGVGQQVDVYYHLTMGVVGFGDFGDGVWVLVE